MLVKTRGILFRSISYSEASVILHVFTEEYGVQSYILNGIRKKKSKHSPAILQPLSLLELLVYHKESGGIQRVSEIRNTPPYTSLPFDIGKSSIALFLNEILYKSIQQGHTDKPLFEFIFANLLWLDFVEKTPAIFHIYFLLKLSHYLGFYPAGDEKGEQAYFDLKNGRFTSTPPEHIGFCEPPQAALLHRFMKTGAEQVQTVHYSRAERASLMDMLLLYYTYHIEGLGVVNARKVLEEVFA